MRGVSIQARAVNIKQVVRSTVLYEALIIFAENDNRLNEIIYLTVTLTTMKFCNYRDVWWCKTRKEITTFPLVRRLEPRPFSFTDLCVI